jgi:ABC-type transport system involved in Fe-S cluster assembly fused permease/ATPase subunit
LHEFGRIVVLEMVLVVQAPTVIELFVIIAIFASSYASPGSSGVLFVSFVLYVAVTISLAQYRKNVKMTVNRADNEASQIATDSLIGFETVKSFNNEAFEMLRFSDAIKFYQAATRQSQSLLVVLNMSQSFLIRAAITGVMLVSARDVLAGRLSIGGFVALQSWVAQLFAPLSWLGTMYNMLASAFADMQNLGEFRRLRWFFFFFFVPPYRAVESMCLKRVLIVRSESLAGES